MSTIGADEAKTKFAELLARVERGERVTITKSGRPVAELVPARAHDAERARAAMARIRARAKDLDLDLSADEIRELRDFGRPGCD